MSDRVSRRAVIAFGVALLTAPLAAVAQSGRVYTVGTLSVGTATQMDCWQPFLALGLTLPPALLLRADATIE